MAPVFMVEKLRDRGQRAENREQRVKLGTKKGPLGPFKNLVSRNKYYCKDSSFFRSLTAPLSALVASKA